MKGLAAPYSVQSRPIERDGQTLYEILAPGCFREAVASGLTPSGKPIALVRGHERNRRRWKDWIICDTTSGLQLWEDSKGLYLEAPCDPPILFSGFSVKLRPYTWKRLGPQVFRLESAGLVHVALLEYPDEPCYASTKNIFKESEIA